MVRDERDTLLFRDCPVCTRLAREQIDLLLALAPERLKETWLCPLHGWMLYRVRSPQVTAALCRELLQHPGTAAGCVICNDLSWSLPGAKGDLAASGLCVVHLRNLGVLPDSNAALPRHLFDRLGLHLQMDDFRLGAPPGAMSDLKAAMNWLFGHRPAL